MYKMEKIGYSIGKMIVGAGKNAAKLNLNVNSPWFYHQPQEPNSLREQRKNKNSIVLIKKH